MRELLHESTDKVINFYMVDSTDHVTEATGLTVSVTLSKNGAAFGAAAGVVAEVDNGIYKLTPTAVDTGTLGPLVARATATGADNSVVETNIVANDPYTALNNIAATDIVSAGAITTLNGDVLAVVDVTLCGTVEEVEEVLGGATETKQDAMQADIDTIDTNVDTIISTGGAGPWTTADASGKPTLT